MAICRLILNEGTINTYLEKKSIQQNVLAKLDIYLPETKIRSTSLTLHKKIKWNQVLGSKPTMIKSLRKTDKIP